MNTSHAYQNLEQLLDTRTDLLYIYLSYVLRHHEASGSFTEVIRLADECRSQLGNSDELAHVHEALSKIVTFAEKMLALHNEFSLPPREKQEIIKLEDLFLTREDTVFWPELKNRPVSFRADIPTEEILIRVNRSWFKQALELVKQNAIKAAAKSQKVVRSVTINARIIGNDIQIRVIDTGHGVPPHLQQRLFNEVIRYGEHGVGTGLVVARLIVEAYDGKIDLESTNEHGTTIVIRLPLVVNP